MAGLYADSGGHPGSLLAQGTLAAPAGGAWNTIAIPPVPLVAGTRYWIALLGRDGTLVYRNRCCTVPGTGARRRRCNRG